jgi:hypothetical protein
LLSSSLPLYKGRVLHIGLRIPKGVSSGNFLQKFQKPCRGPPCRGPTCRGPPCRGDVNTKLKFLNFQFVTLKCPYFQRKFEEFRKFQTLFVSEFLTEILQFYQIPFARSGETQAAPTRCIVLLLKKEDAQAFRVSKFFAKIPSLFLA